MARLASNLGGNVPADDVMSSLVGCFWHGRKDQADGMIDVPHDALRPFASA